MKNRQDQERKFWDKFANRYDSFIAFVFGTTYKTILKHIEADIHNSQVLLEIGTGTGIIPFSIHQKVDSIMATDISPKMIRVANQKLTVSGIKNIDFLVQDSYQLNFPDNTFDVVIASNLLHLLFEPEKAILEARRVLKEGGIFISPTFCIGESKKRTVIANFVGFVSGFKIINKWSKKELENILNNSGFMIVKSIKIKSKMPLVYILTKKV